MAVYFVTGKLGSGKSLAAVGRIRDYLASGRRVATNLDLNLDEMLSDWRDATDVIRLPDRPTYRDVEFIGYGDNNPDVYDESTFGLVVLDECVLSFNTRTWSQDKDRHKFIEWAVQSRKYHWDIIFLVQDLEAIDKQIRETLCEHLVVCQRLDRTSFNLTKAVPFLVIFAIACSFALGWKAGLGSLFGLLFMLIPIGSRIRLPKVHRAAVYYGDSNTSLCVDTWTYVAKDLYKAYATGQKFYGSDIPSAKGLSSLLTPWHLKGRYTNAKAPSIVKHVKFLTFAYNSFCVLIGLAIFYFSFSSGFGSSIGLSWYNTKPQDHIESFDPDNKSTDLTTETVDNFNVRISGSFAFGDGTFKYFFERDDSPIADSESSSWVIRPYGPCAAQIEIAGQLHEVRCDYAAAGLDDSGGVSKGGPQALRDAVAVGVVTSNSNPFTESSAALAIEP